MPPAQEETQQQEQAKAKAGGGGHIQEGQCLPLEEITFHTINKDGKPQEVPAREVFLGKKVVLISIPGAFTPVCSSRHAPGYIEKEEAIKGTGKVDEIVVVATNDPYVMQAWGRSFGADTGVRFLSDQDKAFAKATGLGCELFATMRLKRFSMYLVDGVVKALNVESENNNLGVSSADHMLNEVLAKA